jgi:flagellar M-ring protein FliF
MRAVELMVMGLLGIVVVLVVVRPLVRRIIEPDKLTAGAQAQATLAGRGAANGAEPAAAALQTEAGKMLEIAKISGKLQAEAVKQVGELADTNPHETAAIIREWLSDATASN